MSRGDTETSSIPILWFIGFIHWLPTGSPNVYRPSRQCLLNLWEWTECEWCRRNLLGRIQWKAGYFQCPSQIKLVHTQLTKSPSFPSPSGPNLSPNGYETLYGVLRHCHLRQVMPQCHCREHRAGPLNRRSGSAQDTSSIQFLRPWLNG